MHSFSLSFSTFTSGEDLGVSADINVVVIVIKGLKILVALLYVQGRVYRRLDLPRFTSIFTPKSTSLFRLVRFIHAVMKERYIYKCFIWKCFCHICKGMDWNSSLRILQKPLNKNDKKSAIWSKNLKWSWSRKRYAKNLQIPNWVKWSQNEVLKEFFAKWVTLYKEVHSVSIFNPFLNFLILSEFLFSCFIGRRISVEEGICKSFIGNEHGSPKTQSASRNW